MNRRVPNGTHGGVRGRKSPLETFSYSILPQQRCGLLATSDSQVLAEHVPPAHALIARTVQQALIETSKCPKTPEPGVRPVK